MAVDNFEMKNEHQSQNSGVERRMEKQSDYLPSIQALRVFEQVAHFGNVACAAEELSITPWAASYQLAKIKREPDCILFNRSVKGSHADALR